MPWIKRLSFRVSGGADGRSKAAAVAARRMDRLDREFLPAALELLETPPSPVRVAMIWLICLFFAAALAWSYFGWLDIYAVAAGKIQPSGRSKVVQPLDPAILDGDPDDAASRPETFSLSSTLARRAPSGRSRSAIWNRRWLKAPAAAPPLRLPSRGRRLR